MVGGGDVVMQEVGIGLVEVDALLDDGLAVLMEGNAAGIVRTRVFQVAGLDLERAVTAARVRLGPFADRIAREGRLEILREAAPVGIDPAASVPS